jgi:8-oxo-dGTP pyrophosphatase MutT (NUDIX family)
MGSILLNDLSILKRIQQFVSDNGQCFERTLKEGHITGSSWIVDTQRTHVLLTHHKKLNKWFQLGGHADGDTDVHAVALKEAKEESGLEQVKTLSHQIFDIDIHLVPDNESGHYHYDVRFIFEADRSAPLIISNESHDLSWVELSKIQDFVTGRSVLRMVEKAHKQPYWS